MSSRALLSMLILSSGAFAGVDEDLARAAKSPYDIARFVDTHPAFDWAPLWEALGINGNLVQLQACGEGQECSEELITILDPFQVIVLLRGGISHWEEVYLRFRRPGGPERPGPWSFAGYYSNLVRNYEPKHELIRFGTKPFLLVTTNEHYGSVADATVQDWLDLTRASLKLVFRLALKSQDAAGPEDVVVNSRATLVSLESQPGERITVTYDLDFSIPFARGPDLGSYATSVTYARRNGEFVYESARSQVPETGAGALFDIWRKGSPSNEDFLHYLLPQFKKLASGGSADEKDWLKRFLANCKNTPEKREIQALLAGPQRR